MDRYLLSDVQDKKEELKRALGLDGADAPKVVYLIYGHEPDDGVLNWLKLQGLESGAWVWGERHQALFKKTKNSVEDHKRIHDRFWWRTPELHSDILSGLDEISNVVLDPDKFRAEITERCRSQPPETDVANLAEFADGLSELLTFEQRFVDFRPPLQGIQIGSSFNGIGGALSFVTKLEKLDWFAGLGVLKDVLASYEEERQAGNAKNALRSEPDH